MHELRIYYSFIKTSFLFLLLGLLFGGCAGFILFQQQKTVYTLSQLFEVRGENINGDEKIAMAEEAVGLLREQSLFNSDVQNLYISRIAPYAVKVDLHSSSTQLNSENMLKVSRFLEERNVFVTGSAKIDENKPSLLWFIFVGSALGLLFGLCVSLMKTYLKNF